MTMTAMEAMISEWVLWERWWAGSGVMGFVVVVVLVGSVVLVVSVGFVPLAAVAMVLVVLLTAAGRVEVGVELGVTVGPGDVRLETVEVEVSESCRAWRMVRSMTTLPASTVTLTASTIPLPASMTKLPVSTIPLPASTVPLTASTVPCPTSTVSLPTSTLPLVPFAGTGTKARWMEMHPATMQNKPMMVRMMVMMREVRRNRRAAMVELVLAFVLAPRYPISMDILMEIWEMKREIFFG